MQYFFKGTSVVVDAAKQVRMHIEEQQFVFGKTARMVHQVDDAHESVELHQAVRLLSLFKCAIRGHFSVFEQSGTQQCFAPYHLAIRSQHGLENTGQFHTQKTAYQSVLSCVGQYVLVEVEQQDVAQQQF